MNVLLISMGEYFGGIEKVELDWVKNITHNIKFDFLTPNNEPFKKYNNEIKNLNANWYNFNLSRNSFKNKIVYAKKLYKFLKKNKYEIVHINSSVFLFSFQVVLIAKMCNVEKIIVHSHSVPENNVLKKFLIKILNPIYTHFANYYLACSKQASTALFTKKFLSKNKVQILKNGIDVEKFKFNEELRNTFIKKLNLNNKTVYGHVGAFEKVKNHEFLIEIFYEIQKIESNSILLLIGEGSLQEKIKNKVIELGLKEKVLFLSYREDIEKILNTIDIFIFPSLHEGLGTVLIEAQTNGIPVFCSKGIPIEAKISNNFQYFNLNEKSYNIAQKICNVEISGIERRKEAYIDTIKKGYDIKDVCKELKKIYLD